MNAQIKIRITLIIIFISCNLFAQNILTIEECHEMAKNNYPLIQQYNLVEKTKDFNVSNAAKSYLPKVGLSAKASYQSDVTEIPISIPGIPKIGGLDKDQYSVILEVNQLVWDGGITSSKKEIAQTTAEAQSKKLDVELYSIKERVNQLFFGALLIDAKIKQNELFQEELGRNYTLISNYLKNGIANKSDLDAVKVEQIKARQNNTALKASRKTYLEILSIFTGVTVVYKDLKKPIVEEVLIGDLKRPELEMFEAQFRNYEAQKKMINAVNKPKLGLFVNGGYAKPALNMLKNEFEFYYVGGVKLSWDFSGFYTNKNDKALLELNQNTVNVQKETFLFNTKMETSQEQNEIDKNRNLLEYDDEIITLRNSVKKASEIKVANGTLTVTDLMRDINSEDIAIQEKIQHEIELLQAIYNLKHTTNN